MKKILSLCAFLTVFPMVTACTATALGTVLVIGNKREPIDSKRVHVYQQEKAPAGYEIIAELEAHVQDIGNLARDAVLEGLKERAASVGANAVLVTSMEIVGKAAAQYERRNYPGRLPEVDNRFRHSAKAYTVGKGLAIYVCEE